MICKACVQSVLTYETETRAMRESKSAKPGEDERDDGEMDVLGVAER